MAACRYGISLLVFNLIRLRYHAEHSIYSLCMSKVCLCLRYFSKEPHLAGSKRNNDLAQDIAKKWKEYGFDQVEMARYDVLMTSPRKDMKSKVEIYCRGQVVFTSQSHEKVWWSSLNWSKHWARNPGEDSHIKTTGLLVRNCSKECPRGNKILFCWCGLTFFHA